MPHTSNKWRVTSEKERDRERERERERESHMSNAIVSEGKDDYRVVIFINACVKMKISACRSLVHSGMKQTSTLTLTFSLTSTLTHILIFTFTHTLHSYSHSYTYPDLDCCSNKIGCSRSCSDLQTDCWLVSAS